MILGFKPQFPSKVEDGTKKHSLREDTHDRWHEGMIIHFATGVRSKFYKCFKIGKCISTQRIEIIYENKCSDYPTIIIDGRTFRISHSTGLCIMEQLARNDGFDTLEDFCKWFNKDFKGKIIHWTSLKY